MDKEISNIEFDETSLYFGYPYYVNDYITIYPPTIGDIVKFGEQKYYATVYMLTCIPSDIKSQLFDMGIDYETISDFQLFCLLIKNLTVEDTSLLFKEFDFSKLSLYKSETNNLLYLGNEDKQPIIDEYAYLKIATYLRKMHGIVPKVEHAANKTTKKILIDLDRDKVEENKNKPYKSQLLPLISAMMRYPGFKYNSTELQSCGLYEFIDTVQGAQIYVSSVALLQGSYSGFVDTSKLNTNDFNWLRSINS